MSNLGRQNRSSEVSMMMDVLLFGVSKSDMEAMPHTPTKIDLDALVVLFKGVGCHHWSITVRSYLGEVRPARQNMCLEQAKQAGAPGGSLLKWALFWRSKVRRVLFLASDGREGNKPTYLPTDLPYLPSLCSQNDFIDSSSPFARKERRPFFIV